MTTTIKCGYVEVEAFVLDGRVRWIICHECRRRRSPDVIYNGVCSWCRILTDEEIELCG